MNEFMGDSGLKDDYDSTITAAEFEQSDRGNWQLRIKETSDDGDETEKIFSVGGKDKGWTSYDGGETIQGPTAKSRFHDQSAIQRFIYVVMKCEGAEDELMRRSAELYDHRGPFHAALWVGLRFHWDVVTEKGRRLEEDKWIESDVQVCRPTKYLGVADHSPTASGTRSQTTNSSAPSSNGAIVEISEADLTTLTRLAKEYDTHEEFVDAAMEQTGEDGNPYVKNAVIRKFAAKKSSYESLRG